MEYPIEINILRLFLSISNWSRPRLNTQNERVLNIELIIIYSPSPGVEQRAHWLHIIVLKVELVHKDPPRSAASAAATPSLLLLSFPVFHPPFILLLMLLERGKLSRKSVSPAVSIWPPLDPPIIVEQGTLPLLRNHKSLGGRVIIDHLITPRRLWGQSKVTSWWFRSRIHPNFLVGIVGADQVFEVIFLRRSVVADCLLCLN